MKRQTWWVFFAFFALVSLAEATEPEFAQNADQMVNQMVEQRGSFGKTRSFVVEKTRSIGVRMKNQHGEVKNVTAQVPEQAINKAVRLKVEFDPDSASLRPGAYHLLRELGRALLDDRIIGNRVCIKGHTDSDGDSGYNLRLSYSRAQSVLDFLVEGLGISRSNMFIFGYGENLPLVANDSGIHKQQNRRVEVSLNCAEISAMVME